MGMTNAERQKRHRERVREKLRQVEAPAAPDESDVVLKELLAGQYRAAGLALLEGQAVEDWDGSARCIAEFLEQPVTALVMVEAMQKAGEQAALAVFERWANEKMEEARERPMRTPSPPPEKPRRQRQRAVT